jgi:hypothetical protein
VLVGPGDAGVEDGANMTALTTLLARVTQKIITSFWHVAVAVIS